MDASNVFYIKYQENDKVTFMKYKFSDKVPYSSKKTLSVFSLEQDEMIQAAIMTFREKNPDVIVKYNVAANQDNSLKKEDYIKNLNTELIAGEGADIIIGDGLPVDKYISKGVFADITDIVQSFTKDNKCFTNVSDNYQVDGKYYMFPMKFSPCIWIGKKDALDAVSDLEKCVEYKNKEHMLFGSGIGTDVNFSILYKQNYENLVNSDGMLDTEKAVKFLNQVKELNEVSGFMDGSFNDWVIKDYVCALLLSQANVVYSEVMDVDSLLMYDALMKETNTAMIPAGNKFVPRTCVSINNKSKEKDLAKQFIELLFTKEIQSKREGLGIPMNREAYESGWGDASMYNNEISIGASDYEDVYIVAKEPVNEDIRNEFQELVSGATVPVDYDSTIYELVKGYLSEFINGSITAEQVVTEVNKKASIYLKE